jgi:hypothetical protein
MGEWVATLQAADSNSTGLPSPLGWAMEWRPFRPGEVFAKGGVSSCEGGGMGDFCYTGERLRLVRGALLFFGRKF